MQSERYQRWREANKDQIKEYERRRHLKAAFGITSEQFDEMLEVQGGRCAICRTDEPKGRGVWHVDHDHATGKIRALLCYSCNWVLGKVKDDTGLLKEMISYLEEHR